MALMAFGLVAAAALGGFLLHNFKPASIFMGDAGSLFAGYLLAAYTLQGPALHLDPVLALLIPPILLGVPVLDTTVAIVRRLLTRQAVFAPDKNHIHHRLIDRLSERGAVLTLYLAGGLFGGTGVLMGVLPAFMGYLLASGTIAVSLWGVWHLGCLPPVTQSIPSPAQPSDKVRVLRFWSRDSEQSVEKRVETSTREDKTRERAADDFVHVN
jgi:UDP-GlcNAc:undecaprenyl-phosphate GlcNAc-1-phosphate transferase